MSSTFRTLGQSELLPRYIFAESLYARRRVLEIGAVASTLGQSARFLSTRGARIVVAADSDLAAVADAQTRLATASLRFRASVFDDLEAGSFDLVIVADLAPYVRAPELLKEVVRLVAKNGYLMGGLRNPAGLSLANVMESEGLEPTPTYGMLLDALTSHFRSIEVATQSPVLGYQLAFEKGEGLQVDGSLAGLSEAAYYVVLAGHEPVRFFDPTWVQLPPEPLAFTGGKLEEASGRARTWQDRSDRLKESLGKSRDDVSRAEGELKEAREQLEAARENVARLTAQLEAAANTPKQDGRADELTSKLRRVEAELTIARERALDAEGRASAMRAEVELHQREQKSATVETLAAQENARLERTRREEQASQLEDTRSRLTKAYEELRLVQDEAAAHRVEVERGRLEGGRLAEALAGKERELQTAREKELRLADARTEALAAIEGLQRELERQRTNLAAADHAVEQKEGERLALLRSLEMESAKVQSSQAELQATSARAQDFAAQLAETTGTLTAAQTELEAGRAAQARLKHDIETLASSERTWREMAQQYEGRLNETLANVTALSEQVAQLEALKEQETARFIRLEKDLSTAVGAERSAREQAQALLADAQAKGHELGDDNQRLLEQRDDLRASLSDLSQARADDGRRLEEQTRQIDVLSKRIFELEADLRAAQVAQQQLQEQAAAAETTLRSSLSEREQAWGSDRQALTEARQALEAELHTSRQTAAALTTQLDEHQRAAAQVKAEFEAQQRALGEQLAQRQAAIAQLEQSLERGQQTLDGVRAELTDLESRRQTEVGVLQIDLDERRQAFSNLENTHRADLATLRAQLEQAQAGATQLDSRRAEELLALKADLAGREQRHLELQQHFDQLEQQHHDTADKAAERAGQVAQLTERLREAIELSDRERDDFERRLDEASAGAGAAGKERDVARGEIARLTGQLEQGRQRVAELAQRAARLETEGSSLKSRLAEVEAQATDRLAKVEELTAGLERAEIAAEATDTRLRAELETLQREFATEKDLASSRAQSAQAAHAELEETHRQLKSRAVDREREFEQLKDSLAATEAARTRLEEVLSADRGETARALARLEHDLAQSREALERREAVETTLRGELRELTEALELTREEAGLFKQEAARAAAAASASLEREKELAGRELAEAREAAEAELQAARGALQQRLAELEAESSERRAEFDARRAELDLRIVELTEQVEHFEAELAFGAETRAAEAELRERVEKERDQLKQEAGAAKGWVVGGQAENEKLASDLTEARADLERTRDELLTARTTFAATQRELEGARQELDTQRQAFEARAAEQAALADQLTAARAELGLASQQLQTARADTERVSGESGTSRDELAALQQRLDDEAAARAREAERATEAHQQVLKALEQQLESARNELQLVKGTVERAQSEARGHQAGKLQLQAEFDSLRSELTQVKNSLAESGGEARAIAQTRQAIEAELKGLQRRAEEAEAQLSRTQAQLSDAEGAAAQASEREKGLEAQISQLKGATQGSASELEVATQGRRTAEELLVKLRARYAELETHLVTEVPLLREQVGEMMADNQMLDAERERLAGQVERLETARAELKARSEAHQLELEQLRGATRPNEEKVAALEAQLRSARAVSNEKDQRLEMMQRRVNAQEAEFRRRTTGSAVGPRPTSAAKPAASSVSARAKGAAPADPADDDTLDLEVFELDVDTAEGDELVLLEDEASDPGSKDPRKP